MKNFTILPMQEAEEWWMYLYIVTVGTRTLLVMAEDLDDAERWVRQHHPVFHIHDPVPTIRRACREVSI